MIIYKITNKLNAKCYIGQTVNLSKRWSRHCSSKEKSAISAAIKKYGKENFSIVTIGEYSNETDLNNAEDYFIDFHNSLAPNGYNRVTGQQKNRVWSKESLKKASDSKLGPKNPMFGIKKTEEQKLAISKRNIGKPKSEEHKQKLRLANIGKKATSEAKVNMSLAAKNCKFNKGRFVKGQNKCQ